MNLRKLLIFSLLAAPAATFAQTAATLSITGTALDENGTEVVDMLRLSDPRGNKNVLDLLLADPTVFAEDGKFYAAGTRSYGPQGFTMLESSDLKTWRYARPDSMVLRKDRQTWGSSGFWAPQFFNDGDNGYLMAYVANERCCIAHSETLTGDYTQSEIAPVDNSEGNIDPFIFKDDDGKYYMYHVRFKGGNILYVAELDPSTWHLKNGTLKECFRNSQSWEWTSAFQSGLIMEGPSVIKIDDTYYMFYSANHYQSVDYAVGYATAKSPLGPWTKYSGNPIIHRNIVGEMGSGHGEVFYDNDGNLRYMYHVHYSNTQVGPRKTRIVTLNVDKSKGHPYAISADRASVFIPELNLGARDGKFSGYVRLKPEGTFSFAGVDSEGNTVTYGTDANGALVAGGEPFQSDKEGVYRVIADTSRGTIEFKKVASMRVKGSVLTACDLPYKGSGVFAGEIDLNKNPNVEYLRKTLYFSINNDNSLKIQRIPGTDNVTVPGDGITGEDIRINPGVYNISLDLNRGKLAIDAPVDPYRVSVFGSSVANGQGAQNFHGYAYLYGEQLKSRNEEGKSDHPFYTSGISIGGNTTVNLLDRYDDLIRDHGKYVIFGLSLGNEGIHGNSSPDLIFNRFRDNMLELIAKARADGKIPVVMNNYTRTDYNTTDYTFVKNMNLLIHEWDVPSVNALGTVDDRSGRWATSLRKDDAHPNDEGHRQMMQAIPPSLFDAIEAGKPLPVRDSEGSEITLSDGKTLTFTPEGSLNAFTLSIRLKNEGVGEVFRFVNKGADGETIGRVLINEDGKVVYISPSGTTTTARLSGSNSGDYFYLTFTHYYGIGASIIYMNNRVGVTVKETLAPGTFTIGDKAEYHTDLAEGETASANPIGISEVAFWRSAMNIQEINKHIAGTAMLKSSLEIYAPMDIEETGAGEAAEARYDVPNLATSLNTISLVVPGKSGIESVVAGSSASTPFPVACYTTDGKLVGTVAAGASVASLKLAPGLYVVHYSDGTSRKLIL